MSSESMRGVTLMGGLVARERAVSPCERSGSSRSFGRRTRSGFLVRDIGALAGVRGQIVDLDGFTGVAPKALVIAGAYGLVRSGSREIPNRGSRAAAAGACRAEREAWRCRPALEAARRRPVPRPWQEIPEGMHLVAGPCRGNHAAPLRQKRHADPSFVQFALHAAQRTAALEKGRPMHASADGPLSLVKMTRVCSSTAKRRSNSKIRPTCWSSSVTMAA